MTTEQTPTATLPVPVDAPEDVRDGAVVLAYVHSNEVSFSWHHSMVEMIGWDIAGEGRVLRGGYIAYHFGTDGLIDARNKTVETFLEENRADWLFWLDTDMGFLPDTLDRLFEAADPVDRPMVGALCFAQREMTSDLMGGHRCTAVPTVYDWREVGEMMGFNVRWDYQINTITRVAGTGSACVLIHKSVFEKIKDKFGPVWYNRIPNTTTGQMVSEDLSLCMRAGALDIPIFVHTGVETTHHKELWLAQEDYWRQRAVDPPPYDIPPEEDAAAQSEAAADV